MRFNARLRDIGVIETSQLSRAIEEEAEKRFGDQVKVESLSLESLLGEWVYEIVRGQRQGLAFALATIAVMMIIAMRSVRVGLISMLPNVLPLLVLLGWLGWFWESVDTRHHGRDDGGHRHRRGRHHSFFDAPAV